MKSVLLRIAVIGIGVLIGLGTLEAGLRLWFSTFGTEQERVKYVYDQAEINAKTSQFIGVPFLNFTLNPNLSDVSKQGFRGADVAIPKPPGVYRILAIGGSTTFGIGLTTEETWPFQLQSILREQYGYHNVEVINMGVPGYYSLNSVINLATHGLALEPDLVIDTDGINDAVISIYQDPACYHTDSPLLGMGMDQGVWQSSAADLPASTLYRFLAVRFGWMQDPTTLTSRAVSTGFCPPEPSDGQFSERLAKNPPIYFERNLRSIAALAKSEKAQAFFVTTAWDASAAKKVLAADPTLDGTRALIMAIDEQNALIPGVAKDTGALFVDLASELTGSDYFQGDHIHPTPQGAHEQAAILAAYLNTSGVLPY